MEPYRVGDPIPGTHSASSTLTEKASTEMKSKDKAAEVMALASDIADAKSLEPKRIPVMGLMNAEFVSLLEKRKLQLTVTRKPE